MINKSFIFYLLVALFFDFLSGVAQETQTDSSRVERPKFLWHLLSGLTRRRHPTPHRSWHRWFNRWTTDSQRCAIRGRHPAWYEWRNPASCPTRRGGDDNMGADKTRLVIAKPNASWTQKRKQCNLSCCTDRPGLYSGQRLSRGTIGNGVGYRRPHDNDVFFFNAIFCLFLVIVVNLPFKRFLLGAALRRGELLTIYSILMVAVSVSGQDFTHTIFGTLGNARWFTSPENE